MFVYKVFLKYIFQFAYEKTQIITIYSNSSYLKQKIFCEKLKREKSADIFLNFPEYLALHHDNNYNTNTDKKRG